MERFAYLVLIAGITAIGGYFGWLDLRALSTGTLPSGALVYGAFAFLLSGAVLFVDFRRMSVV